MVVAAAAAAYLPCWIRFLIRGFYLKPRSLATDYLPRPHDSHVPPAQHFHHQHHGGELRGGKAGDDLHLQIVSAREYLPHGLLQLGRERLDLGCRLEQPAELVGTQQGGSEVRFEMAVEQGRADGEANGAAHLPELDHRSRGGGQIAHLDAAGRDGDEGAEGDADAETGDGLVTVLRGRNGGGDRDGGKEGQTYELEDGAREEKGERRFPADEDHVGD